MKCKCSLAIIALLVIIASCKKDNFKAPSSTISGRVVYNGQPLSLRSNGVQLELWQHGYQLFTKIPVYIDQDGNFSAAVFDGNYKLTLLKGNGPWADKTDSIDVAVKGNAVVDVPVTPFFTVSNETFTYNAADTSVTATFKVNQVVAGKNVDKIALSIGFTQFVDVSNNIVTNDINAPADLTQTITIKQTINPNRFNASNQATTKKLLGDIMFKKYGYVRVGVRTAGQSERIYTPVKKISL